MGKIADFGIILLFLFLPAAGFSQSGLAGAPAGFSRLGADVFTVAGGQAVVASQGSFMSAFSNPSLPAMKKQRMVSLSTTSLGLDRSLHSAYASHPVGPDGMLAYGVTYLNHGSISIRNNNGEKIDEQTPWEAVGLFGFSLALKRLPLTAGINLKYRMAHLYEKIGNSESIGIDLGLVWTTPVSGLLAGISILDINSDYRWDTKEIYNEQGNNTIDKLPLRYRAGLSWKLSENLSLLGETEFWQWTTDSRMQEPTTGTYATDNLITSKGKKVTGILFRSGLQYQVMPSFLLLGGIDRITEKESPKFSGGFRYRYEALKTHLDFAVVVDDQAPQNLLFLSAGIEF